jgi:hypothetical protein
MLQRMLHFSKDDMPTFMDATDGLAAAYCHFLQMGRPALEKGYRNLYNRKLTIAKPMPPNSFCLKKRRMA